MIETDTVLILGAGASAPYGYPIGSDLKTGIVNSLTAMVEKDYGWVNGTEFSKDLIKEFVFALKNTRRPSIDSFLAKQKEEFTDIGKIAIVNQISKCEDPRIINSSVMKKKAKFDSTDDWYGYLVEILYESKIDEIGDNLSIVTFNYDRSLEYFLLKTLLADFGALETVEDCLPIIKKIPIIHMYGRLDPLPWEVPHEECREYGENCSDDDLIKISENIKLIHEAELTSSVEKANRLVYSAERIYFLGMDLYRNRENITNFFDESFFYNKEILATGYGLKSGEIKHITNFFKDIQKSYREGIRVLPELDQNYRVSNKKSLISIREHNPF